MRDQVYGGPSITTEKCKSCKKKWTRYRTGSNDWQYTDCPKCAYKNLDILEILKGVQNELNKSDGKIRKESLKKLKKVDKALAKLGKDIKKTKRSKK